MKSLQQLLDQIQLVNELINDLADEKFIADLQELKQKLEKNKFYLVVTGLFKRGKSSLVNALIGKNIAPVAVTPVTAIITLFEYNKTPGCEIIFNDNQRKSISFDEIVYYASEEENPENIKNVAQIKVFLNENELLKKCCIVDTPGLGSVFEHNSATTYNYIPKIDAALFILSADIPISKNDAEFLHEIYSTVPQIIFVLNKIDLLTKQELDKLIDFNSKIIAGIINKPKEDIVIIPVSGKLANEKNKNSNFDLLTHTIEQLIDENKDKIIAETGNAQLTTIIKNILNLLVVKADTIRMPVQMIEEKQSALNKSIAVMNETRIEFDILIKGQLDNILENNLIKADEQLHELLSEKIESILVRFNEEKIINNKTILKFLEEFTTDIIARMQKIKDNTEQQIINEFNQVLVKHQLRSETFLNEFTRVLKELFNLSFVILSEQFDLNVYSSFYFLKYIDSRPIDTKLPAFYLFLPKKIQQIKYLSIVKKNIENFIEINKGRMKSDIAYKVNESFRKFKSEEEKQIKMVYQRIQKLLNEAIDKKTKSANEIEEEINHLNMKIEKLNQLL